MITMEKIEERLTVVEHNTQKILTLLQSDDDFKTKGLVETSQEHEKRIALLELQKKIDKVKNGGIGFVFGGLIVIIWFLIQEWFKHNVFGK